MKPLPRPSWDAASDFDAIVATKHSAAKRVLTQVRQAVHLAIGRYLDQAPHLENFRGGTPTPEQRTALLECFESGRRTNSCKAMLARLELKRCPLCGVDTAKTFDHYLPKSLFPELVVCAYNLIHVCHRCNSARGDDWLGKHGRSTLHLYYDEIETQEPLLEAEVAISKDGPCARFRVNATLDAPGFAGRFARHCEALDLVEVFEGCASAMLLDIVDDLRGQELDIPQVQAALEHSAMKRGERHGANHWEAALRRGIARSNTFIVYALNGGEA